MCVLLKIHICIKVVFKYKFYIKPREIIYGLYLYLNFFTGVIIIINAIYVFEKKVIIIIICYYFESDYFH